MEKKYLLLNYCMQKFAQEEQKIYELSDIKTALLGLGTTCRPLFRRCISGCYQQEICFADVQYPQTLLFLICQEALSNGDNLIDQFDFTVMFNSWPQERSFIQDAELALYLEKDIFYEERSLKKVNYEAYRELTGKDLNEDNVMSLFFQRANLRGVKYGVLPLPEPCAETEMIDRAFDRLKKDVEMDTLLNSYNRHNIYGQQYLQLFFFETSPIKRMDVGEKITSENLPAGFYKTILRKIKKN